MSANAQTPTAEAIIANMASRYATIHSYRDTGVVLSHWPDKDTPDELHFKTFFVRPDRFRFEWVSHHPYPPLRHITSFQVVWSNSSGAFTYWDKPAKVERERDLSMAVAGATGVSSGSAHTVPRLLLPTIGGFALTELRGLTLVGQVEFETTACFHVRGTQPRGGGYVAWIGVDDYLLRKLQTQHNSNVTQEEIHRDIQTDGDIPEAIFHFTPPNDA